MDCGVVELTVHLRVSPIDYGAILLRMRESLSAQTRAAGGAFAVCGLATTTAPWNLFSPAAVDVGQAVNEIARMVDPAVCGASVEQTVA